MGFILKYMVPTNVAAKSAVLIQNCHGFCDGVEKLSDVMSSNGGEYGHGVAHAGIVHGSISAIGGTVDADGSGGHLAYGHDVGKLARCHPVPMVHHFALYERQHTVTSTETEKSDEEECYEKL